MHPRASWLVIIALGFFPHLAMSAADAAPAAETRVMNETDRSLLIASCHRIACTIQATEQVLPRLSDASAKDLLGVIKKDSEAMHRELSALMQEHGMGVPMLDKGLREDVAKLATSENDTVYSAYRDHQLEISEDLADALAKAAKDAEHPDVRAFAVKWQPSARHHYQILKKYEPVQ